ncbi:hypothetical protein ACHAXT_012925 [Thalassiosira profunda]
MSSPGVQTPSTARASRLRRPLESPFPSPAPTAADPSAPDGASHGLSSRHLAEIKTVFQIFDPTLSGYVDINGFEALVLSLGLRMTRLEIEGLVESMWEGRHPDEEASAEERRRIDLQMAAAILAKKGYANKNEEDEMQIYFRVLDGGNKGHIALEDLRRVQQEVIETERQMKIGSSGLDDGAVGGAALKAMIEEFDCNGDGVIYYDEFRRILGPVLSSVSS